jgi:glyoxylase I family protein
VAGIAEAPRLDGLHHLTLTVRDLEASIEWYAAVLGMAVAARAQVNGLDKALLTREDSVAISFVAHGDSAIEGRFDEHRVGLDHVAFAVTDRAELERWVAHLDALGIHHGPVTQATTGWLVTFRDPDNIALEFYSRSLG